MVRGFVLGLALSGFGLSAFSAANSELEHARDLYNHTDYDASLAVLNRITSPNGAVLCLMGQDLIMKGEFHRASDVFRKAVDLEPGNSDYYLWLGRAYGRRAETTTPLLSAPLASKARQAFEKAVALNPRNKEALDDLFDYYLQAPRFLGGGYDKASKIADNIASINPAEGQFAQAKLADERKEYASAEDHLRRAVELAPRQVGRVLDLGKFLARQGRFQESDAIFAHALSVAPNSPRVIFAAAKTLVQHKRNLEEARDLLRRYLQTPLGPGDPPRTEAERLLRTASGA